MPDAIRHIAATVVAPTARAPKRARTVRVGAALAVLTALTLGCPSAEAKTSAEAKPRVSPLPPSTWVALTAADLKAPALRERLDAAKAKGWPVLIDFAAEWCAACEELDKDVLSHPKMRAPLARFLKLRVDATLETEDITSLQARFVVNVLPTVVVLGRDGTEVKAARIDEYVDQDTFQKRVARVP